MFADCLLAGGKEKSKPGLTFELDRRQTRKAETGIDVQPHGSQPISSYIRSTAAIGTPGPVSVE